MNRTELFLKKRIGIIGGSRAKKEILEKAELMGKLIAKNGYILVNGGMGGVMEASSRGAKSENGLVISILPGINTDESNIYTDIAIPTGLGYMRNPLVVFNSDIIIAIDGSFGTLSELAYSNIYNKKIFGLDSWDIPGIEPFETPEEIIEEINKYFGI